MVGPGSGAVVHWQAMPALLLRRGLGLEIAPLAWRLAANGRHGSRVRGKFSRFRLGTTVSEIQLCSPCAAGQEVAIASTLP